MVGLAKRLGHYITKSSDWQIPNVYDHQVHIITKHADLQCALPKCQCCPAKVLQGARPYRLARGWTVRMTNATL